MNTTEPRPAPGTDALVSAGIAALGAFLWWCGRRLLPDGFAAGYAEFSHQPPTPSGLGFLAGVAAAAAGLGLTVWWAAGCVCAFTGLMLHRFGFKAAGTRILALAPRPLRHLAAAALGLSLAAGSGPVLGGAPAVPAIHAAAVRVPVPEAAAPVQSGEILPLPDSAAGTGTPADETGDTVSPLWRPLPPAPVGGGLLTGVPRPDPDRVVVASGDTLWSLAGRQLGPLAADSEIAAHWPRWYELNKDLIGPDPGLIHPGQVLAVPPL